MAEQTANKRKGGMKAILAAMAANLGIAVMKLLAWLLTGAASLLAEAIHSAADTANQIIMLLGDKSAAKQADSGHQFGYGRARFVNAFLVALILFSMGGLFAVYEAFHKFEELRAGHGDDLLESRWWWVAIIVLVGSIIMESLSLRTALRESKPHRVGMPLWRFIHESKEPEFMVVILEDTAALTGLCFAFVGIITTLLTGNAIFDIIGSFLIGILLIVVAIILAVETKSLLIGESADKQTLDQIRACLLSIPGFDHVVYLQTLYIGPDELLVAGKVAVNENEDAAQVAHSIDDAEQRIRQAVPNASPIYIEIDIWQPETSDGSAD